MKKRQYNAELEEIPEDIIQLLNVAIVMPDGLPGKSINTNSVKNDPVYGIGVMNTSLLSGEKMSMVDQSEYKYIIHIDGNVNAYRLLTTMLTGSLILRVKSQYTSWFEHMIHGFDIDTPEDIQNKHFIWIKEDLSNLFSVIQWCNKNESICKILSKQCLKLANKISSNEFILQYTQMMIWASVEGTVLPSEKKSLDHNSDLNISSELEEVNPEVENLSLIQPEQMTVPYFEKSYNPTSPVYSPGDWGISTPEGPPPRSPYGTRGQYSPVSPEGPPPRSPYGTRGQYSPVSPEGPPPGVYTPPTPPLPPSNMSGQEVTKILEDINEKLHELKEGKDEDPEDDEDILKIKEPKEEEESKGGGETKKIKIN